MDVGLLCCTATVCRVLCCFVMNGTYVDEGDALVFGDGGGVVDKMEICDGPLLSEPPKQNKQRTKVEVDEKT